MVIAPKPQSGNLVLRCHPKTKGKQQSIDNNKHKYILNSQLLSNGCEVQPVFLIDQEAKRPNSVLEM